DEVLSIGDRIALMKDGEIAQVGTPEEIVTNPENDYVKAFVKDIDRSKVLKVKQFMRPANPKEKTDQNPVIASEDLLYKSYDSFKNGIRELTVKDGGKVVGIVEFDKVFEVLAVGNEVEEDAR